MTLEQWRNRYLALAAEMRRADGIHAGGRWLRCFACYELALRAEAVSLAYDNAVALHFAGRRPSSARQLGIAY